MPSDFTGFDYVVLTLTGIFALFGLVRGFTREAISLAGWIAGAVVVRFFHEPVTRWLAPHVGGEAAGAIVAFLLLFFGTVIVGSLIGGMAGGVTRRSGLGAIDRVLGLGFGAVKGVILSAVLFLLLQFATGLFDVDKESPDWLANARTAPLLGMTAEAMVGWVHALQEPDTKAKTDDGADRGANRGARPGEDARPAASKNKHEDKGYSREDREALDRLLESGKGVDI